MPYPRPFIRLTAEGSFGTAASSDVDIWRCNFNFATNSGTDYSPPRLLAFAQAAAAPLGVYHANVAVKAGTAAWLESVSAAAIGVDGRYVGGGTQPTSRYLIPSPVQGSGATVNPYSTALCLTWRTAIVRGPGHAGRVYWPATSMPITLATGAVGSGVPATILTAAQTLVNGLNAAANATFGAGHTLTVMSKVGLGIAAPVVAVEVGQRLDSQERRESQISEAYVRGAVSVGLRSVEERDERLRDLIEEAVDQALDAATP